MLIILTQSSKNIQYMISGVVGWTVRTCTALKQILMLSTVIVFVQDKCNQMLLVTLILQADFFLEKNSLK